ncbi:undecaprenyl-phosphate glucose phosphotransferase [soil metagenome]
MATPVFGTTEMPTGTVPVEGAASRGGGAFAEFVPDGWSGTIIVVAIDIAAASSAVAVGVWWSSRTVYVPSPWMAALFVPIVIGLLWLQSFYRRRLDRSFIDQLVPLETNIALAAILPLSVATFGAVSGPAAAVDSKVWICAALVMPAARLLHAVARKRQGTHRRFRTPTLIVGHGVVATRVIERLRSSPEYGLEPVGIIDIEPSKSEPDPRPGLDPDVPILGPPDAIDEVIRRTGARAIVIAFSQVPDGSLTRVIQVGHRHKMRVWVVPRMFDVVGEKAFVEHIGGLPLLALPHTDPRGWQFTVKHVFDVVGAALGLLAISPFFIGLIVLVRLSSPGPIFFRQDRIGRDGKVFQCLKFRSMRPPRATDADFEATSGSAPGGIEGEDRRTSIGKIMRATSLDELPQLINVLKGDMSLVGPRPERPQFVEYFEIQVHRYGERHRVKAGMTGWAQVHGLRGQTSIADRVEWDNFYIQNWSLALDLKTLLLTVPAVLRGAD